MIERLYVWFLERPVRLISFGQSTTSIAGMLLVLAAIGRVFLIVGSLSPAGASDLVSMKLPFPTFFVPEGAPAIFLCIVIAALGLIAVHVGRSWQRMLCTA